MTAATPITGYDGVNNLLVAQATSIAVSYSGSGWARLANSVLGSSVQVTDEFIRVQSEKFSVGNDGSPENDALVIEDGTASIPMLSSPCVVPAYKGPSAITVKPDATDAEMEAGTAFKTLAQAIAAINRKWLPYRVTINVSQSYDGYGDISINHVMGDQLAISGMGTYTAPSDSMPRQTGFMYLYNNTSSIVISNMRFRFATTSSLSMREAFVARIQRFLHLYRCVIEDTGIGGTILRADQSTAIYVQECALVNAAGATNAFMFVARYGGIINSAGLIGDLSPATVLFDVWLGTIYHDGTAPVCGNATIAVNATKGAAVYAISSRAAFRGTQGSQTSTPVSMDIPMSSGASYWTEGGWNSAMYQGYTTGKGKCTTCLWFNVSALAGKTIVSATLKLHRYDGVGKASGVNVRLYNIGNTSASGSLSRGDQIASSIGTVASGETRELALPSGVVEALVSGSNKALGLYPGDGSVMDGKVYSSNYARWYKDAVLSVVYQ